LDTLNNLMIEFQFSRLFLNLGHKEFAMNATVEMQKASLCSLKQASLCSLKQASLCSLVEKSAEQRPTIELKLEDLTEALSIG